MRKISQLGIASLLLLGVSVGIILGGVGYAQQTPGAGNAIRVSPVRTDMVINPGETKQVVVTVENLTKTSAEYQAIINDFVASKGEDGQPALILDADKYAPSHSLKRYITKIANVTVPAGQSKEVKVSITVPKDAAGGGYFGAVRFTPANGGDPTKNVSIAASVGSLLLVKVPGDIVESVKLDSFDVRGSKEASSGSSFFTTNKNLYAVARFTNTGNVHEQPFGKIVLKKSGKIVQTVEINGTEPRGNVLPDSTRRFAAKLDKVGMWGKYTVEGNFGYGSNGQLLSAKSSFFVLPLLFIVIGVLLVALIVFAIVGLPRMIKRYNANVVRRASRR
jgi:hypothetical protein